MLLSLEDIVDAAIPDWPTLAPADRAAVFVACAGFARAQMRKAPFHIRAGFTLLYWTFRLYALVRVGPFASRQARSRLLSEFSSLPLPMVSGVERVVRTTTLLAFFDSPQVLAALGEESPETRQELFRQRRANAGILSP
jgi:hypothetical protein